MIVTVDVTNCLFSLSHLDSAMCTTLSSRCCGLASQAQTPSAHASVGGSVGAGVGSSGNSGVNSGVGAGLDVGTGTTCRLRTHAPGCFLSKPCSHILILNAQSWSIANG